MLRVEIPEPPPSEVNSFAVVCKSDQELEVIWFELVDVLESWADDGFDGAFDTFEDGSEGFGSNRVSIRRADGGALVGADLGTHAAGGFLALVDRLDSLVSSHGIDAVLRIVGSGDKLPPQTAAPKFVEVGPEDSERLRAAGGGVVRVEVLGRLVTGIQSFQLAPVQPEARPRFTEILDRWYDISVAPRLQFEHTRRQIGMIAGDGFIHVDVTLPGDPIVAIAELVAMLATSERSGDGELRLRLYESAMLLPFMD